MSINSELPQYFRNPDYALQETYQELLNVILTGWFNGNGFFQPTLTDAQVTEILALPTPPPVGTHWFNSTVGKMQLIVATGVVETVTSA